MAGPQKTKHRVTVSFSNFVSGQMPRGKKSKDTNRRLLTHAHGIIIHNRQKGETFTDR